MREDDTLPFTQLAAVFRRLINEANANLKHMHSGGDNLQTCSWLSVTSCSPRIPSVNIKKHQLSLKLPAPMSHGLWRHPFWNPGQTVTLVKERLRKKGMTLLSGKTFLTWKIQSSLHQVLKLEGSLGDGVALTLQSGNWVRALNLLEWMREVSLLTWISWLLASSVLCTTPKINLVAGSY